MQTVQILCNADNDIGWEDMCMMEKDEEGDHNLAGGVVMQLPLELFCAAGGIRGGVVACLD